LIFKKNTIIPRDRLGQIRDKRNVHLSEAALFSWRLSPGKMSEMRVDRCSNDFSADLSELIDSVARKALALGKVLLLNLKAIISVGQTKVKSRG
jgi:hypothetical protein